MVITLIIEMDTEADTIAIFEGNRRGESIDEKQDESLVYATKIAVLSAAINVLSREHPDCNLYEPPNSQKG